MCDNLYHYDGMFNEISLYFIKNKFQEFSNNFTYHAILLNFMKIAICLQFNTTFLFKINLKQEFSLRPQILISKSPIFPLVNLFINSI